MTERALYFSNATFEASHGKRPRGYGTWAFGFEGERYFTPEAEAAGRVLFTIGNLTEAKAEAKAHGKSRGFEGRIEVLS